MSQFDPRDVTQRSGSPAHISWELERLADVVYVAPLADPWRWWMRTRERVHRRILGTIFFPDRDPRVGRAYAAAAAARLRQLSADVVFSTDVIPLAHLETPLPIVFWNDATFANLLDYYPAYTGLSRATRSAGLQQAKLALDRCALALYATRWAARSAVEDSGADPRKVRVLPHCANVKAPDDGGVCELIERRATDLPRQVRLLLVGVDWGRKGCDVAVRTTVRLRELGVPAKLDILGCRPPAGTMLPDHVSVHGFAAKDTAEGRALIDEAYARATLFLFPTRAECQGISLVEAAMFGLPCITTRTGGVADAVDDGQTGLLLPPEADAEAFAEAVMRLVEDPLTYRRFAAAARALAAREYRWDVQVGRLYAALEEVVRSAGDRGTTRA